MRRKHLAVLGLAGVIWACASTASAQLYNLTITESGGTISLTQTGLGTFTPNVTSLGPDSWQFTYGLALDAGSAQWAEPDGSGDVNTVSVANNSTTITVKSEVLAGSGLANGSKDSVDFHLTFGSVLNVTFNDLGDPINPNNPGTVPDPISTMPILGAVAGVLCGFAPARPKMTRAVLQAIGLLRRTAKWPLRRPSLN